MNYLVSVILCILFSTACTENPKVNPTDDLGEGVYIINEGNFDWGEGTITFWNQNTGVVYDNLFKKVNERTLGNVAQSMTAIGNYGYIVVNNSRKIEVVNAKDCKSVATIEGMVSPRYILPIDDKKFYVSDLYADGVYVVFANEVVKKIPVSGWTNRMALDKNGYVWVARRRTDFDLRPGGNSVILIDTSTNEVVDSVEVGKGVEEMEVDENGAIWTACTVFHNGDYPALVKIENKNLHVYRTEFPIFRLRINRNFIYFLMNGGLYKMAIHNTILPEKPIFSGTGNLYGIGTSDGYLYISDAKDYVQRGTVYRLNMQGNILDSVKAGVIPGEFCFID